MREHPATNHQLERNCSIQKTRSRSRSRGLVILQKETKVSFIVFEGRVGKTYCNSAALT